MTINYKALAAAAAEREDQTETKSSFEFNLPEAGPGVARFVEYIECGQQPRKAYKGKEKKPADLVILKFDLLSPQKNIREHEGTTYCDTMTVRLNKLLDGKAGFKKLFNTMARGRENIKHMAQMLGEAFIVNVIHSESGEGDKKRTYANLRDENGTWHVNAPVIVDALAGTQQDISAQVMPPLSPIRIFLWDDPNQECWDSLFIDGTYTKKVDGVETEVSKNWIQSLIVGAVNFPGSPLEAMLGGMPDLPTAEEQTGEDGPTEEEAEAPVEEAEEAPAPEPEKPAEPVKAPVAPKQTVRTVAAPAAAKGAAAASPNKGATKVAVPAKAPGKAPAAAAKPAAAPAKAPAAKPAAKAAASKPTANDALAALGLG